ncbi:MAG: D-2-hydroxyacid dehydrogenase [Myxococcota bacterium]|jgi:glycerate dehydrogenase|nr:D-2-hydroxyacid dehydrogenase [Myxococcota bacterium]
MTQIVVLDGQTVNPGDNDWGPLSELGQLLVHERSERDQIVERVRDAQVVITNKVRLDREILSSLPGLKGVCVFATGFDMVDVGAARELGIPVCNVPAYSTESVVEHTFALLLGLARRVELHSGLVAAGEWSASPDFSFWRTPQLELAGLTLGVIGYGSIGRRVAAIGLAFGMQVLATPSRRYPPDPGVVCLDIDAIFERADVVTLHCPLQPDTAGLVRADRLRRMKPSAFLVNTARGGLVREPDLARALREGWIAGAALDTLSTEPPPPDHPLLSGPNLIVTPHLAWTSLASRKRVLTITAQNVRSILAGAPIHVVNP